MLKCDQQLLGPDFAATHLHSIRRLIAVGLMRRNMIQSYRKVKNQLTSVSRSSLPYHKEENMLLHFYVKLFQHLS